MRVLHLPYNIASQVDTTVRALRDIGVDARGLVLNNSAIQSCGESIETRRSQSWRRHPFRRMVQNVSWWRAVMRALRWADVVHYRYGVRGSAALPFDLDLRYLARANKPHLIDFCGADIRIREIASQDNPYIAQAYDEGQIPPVDKTTSAKRQAVFARYGFRCIVRKFEMLDYVQRDLFPASFITAAPVLLCDFQPKYPDPAKARPLVVHCPSRKEKKGTRAVLEAIEELRRDCCFDFRLIHDVKHCEAMRIVRECDVMLDQFVAGEHGNAALEAMALGKPAVCYLKPSIASCYLDDLPIVNASQHTLPRVLRGLLQDGPRRRELGLRSRRYVEKYHDARKVAAQLVGIYTELLEETGGAKSPTRRAAAQR